MICKELFKLKEEKGSGVERCSSKNGSGNKKGEARIEKER